jgi:hypothetical protein
VRSPAGPFGCARRLHLPAGDPPTLTVVVDTEEEFDWSAPFDAAATATGNIREQALAQAVFDRHGVVPCYVIDYPVAASDAAREILRSFADSGRSEIGAHLHPWVNPPADAPVDRFHSYPGNLPPALEREKLARLTERIEEGFGQPPKIYKAGRYGIGPATDGILTALGYRIDVSVVPHFDFSADAGPDFTSLPAGPFVTKAGVTSLPLSVHFTGCFARLGPRLYPHLTARRARALRLPAIAARAGLMERLRLSPEGHSLADMIRQTRSALAAGERLFMLTYHSSSLLPGATSYVRGEADRDRFLAALDGSLTFFLSECAGRAASVSAAAALLRS